MQTFYWIQGLTCFDPGINLREKRNRPFAFLDRLVKHRPEQFKFVGKVESVTPKRPFFVAIEKRNNPCPKYSFLL